jgi:hypothetical protein
MLSRTSKGWNKNMKRWPEWLLVIAVRVGNGLSRHGLDLAKWARARLPVRIPDVRHVVRRRD